MPARFANLAIIAFLAVASVDLVTGLEHWPFGSYPMYSLRYTDRLEWLQLYGATEHGEIPLRGEDFAPFDEARLVMALQRLEAEPDRERKLRQALENLAALYKRRHPEAPLGALRLYSVRWQLRPDPEFRSLRDRTLIAEIGGNSVP